VKLKQQPDDFQVEELTDLVPGGEGPFAFYRLEKRGWSTPDAAGVICRRWRLARGRISFGGLKDRHAHTIQHLTIFRGPRRQLTHQRLHLTYLGQLDRALAGADIRANRFQVVVRALALEEAERAEIALEEVRHDGFANYFDDQRFGSVAPQGGFIARDLMLGNYESALRRALAAPYEHDRAAQKKEKAVLRAHWGDWPRCRDLLPRGPARIPIAYLCGHAGDFRGALGLLPADLRGLYLSAYQSHLWNRMLARWLTAHLRPEQQVPVRLRLGEVPMPRNLDDAQRTTLEALRLPLPSHRVVLATTDPLRALLDEVLKEEGLKQEDFKLTHFREMFFSKGDRAALCRPANLAHESGADELSPRLRKLRLRFELPRGCYATLLVKRITHR
jgi:tRNA pseudouridine13 synthase